MNWVTPILTALLGAGLLDLIVRGIAWLARRRRKTRPQVVEAQRIHDAVAQADQSITVVARARDELEADNKALREQLDSERKRYDLDRADWRAERAEMRAELNRMEQQMREQHEQAIAAQERSRAMLVELQELKAKFGIQ